MMISVDERIPEFRFRLSGKYDAKGMAYQSRLEDTSTGMLWVVTGELALALRRLILSYLEEEQRKEDKAVEA